MPLCLRDLVVKNLVAFAKHFRRSVFFRPGSSAASILEYRVSNTEYRVSSIEYRVSNIEYRIASIEYLISNIEYLIPQSLPHPLRCKWDLPHPCPCRIEDRVRHCRGRSHRGRLTRAHCRLLGTIDQHDLDFRRL